MSSVAPRIPGTFEDYVAADEACDGKLERLHGEIFAMAGGSPAHAYISETIGVLLRLGLRGSPCRSTSSDQRVLLPNDDAAYPDVSVWCGAAEFRDGKTLVNPTVIVEVLSPSTATWDRTGKLELYRGIPSVRHILLVEHDSWYLTLVSRRDDGSWSYDAAGAGGSLTLQAIGVTLNVDEVYEGMDAVEGPPRERRPPAAPERDPTTR